MRIDFEDQVIRKQISGIYQLLTIPMFSIVGSWNIFNGGSNKRLFDNWNGIAMGNILNYQFDSEP